MTHTDNNGFNLADWRVSPGEGLVTRRDEVVHLEPLAMEVLVYLAHHAGEVVSREALEKEVWRGAVIGYDAVTNTIIKLRKALQDNARQPRYIATIPKKGYRLIAEVTWQEETTAVNQPRDVTPGSLSPGNRRHAWHPGTGWILAIVAGISLLALGWYGMGDHRVAPQQSSIVVLPFVNMGDDPRQDYLADGMTEDITTDLSRLSDIRVLASNTALNYKGKQVSPEQVGKELDVKFVLKGSLRQSGGELRVNAQLVDTTTGYNVWAERYDRSVSEVFAVQDEVTQNIVSALALNLTNQEKQRLARNETDSLKAYDFFQEGQRLYKINTIETSQQAYEMYRKAIELDPNYGRAYGAQAVNLAMEYRRGWSDSPMETLDRALVLANKAVALDDSIPQTWWALGFVHLARKEFTEAEQAASQSVEVAPNYADGYGLMALINSYQGRAKHAISLNDRAIKLNPYYSYEYLNTYGIAWYVLGDYEQAITSLEASQLRNPNHLMVKLMLAASYVEAQRIPEAEWIVTELLQLSPNLNLSTVANNIPFAQKALTQRLVDNLRLAGLPG